MEKEIPAEQFLKSPDHSLFLHVRYVDTPVALQVNFTRSPSCFTVYPWVDLKNLQPITEN